jgi:hypothetical protein
VLLAEGYPEVIQFAGGYAGWLSLEPAVQSQPRPGSATPS